MTAMSFDRTKPCPPQLYYVKYVVREARRQMDHMHEGMTEFPEEGINISRSFKEGHYKGLQSASNNLKEG